MKGVFKILNPNQIRLDINDFGKQYILTGIRPTYRYIDGVRTEERVGTTYEVALPAQAYEKIRVRVDGDQEIDDSVLESPEVINVIFKNLIAHFYFMNSTVGVKATADSAVLLKGGPNKSK